MQLKNLEILLLHKFIDEEVNNTLSEDDCEEVLLDEVCTEFKKIAQSTIKNEGEVKIPSILLYLKESYKIEPCEFEYLDKVKRDLKDFTKLLEIIGTQLSYYHEINGISLHDTDEMCKCKYCASQIDNSKSFHRYKI